MAQSNYEWIMDKIRPAMAEEAVLAKELGCEAQLVEILVAEWTAFLFAPEVVATPAPAAAPTSAGMCVCVCVCVLILNILFCS